MLAEFGEGADEPVRGFVEDHGVGREGDLLENRLAAFFNGQKTEVEELVGGEARGAEGGDDRRGAGDGDDGNLFLQGGLNQDVGGV